MGFFGRKDEPPQDAIESAPPVDPEKDISPHQSAELPEVQPPAVDPALESRLLRKLDWNVVTLLAFLCKVSGYQ